MQWTILQTFTVCVCVCVMIEVSFWYSQKDLDMTLL